MMNALVITAIKVARFSSNVCATAMKREVLFELEYQAGLSGEQPPSNKRCADDNTRTETSRFGADYYDVQR
jgi:hypothetical protein